MDGAPSPSKGADPQTLASVLVEVKVMYLFAGQRRQADVGSCLNKMSTDGLIDLKLLEFDIERSEAHDLRSNTLWEQIHTTLQEGRWFLIVSPPCNTFSRARFQWRLHPGPRPLRSHTWPKGFPWLSNAHKAVVSEANEFVSRCIDACFIAIQHGGWFLLEHPEDLGVVNGEVPGTIWQWEDIHNLFTWCDGFTCAIHQCHFGAPTSKPTRLMSNVVLQDSRCHKGFPQFDSTFRYLGPLPKSCGHVHADKLVGKQNNQWKTGPSAAYPPGMCAFIADAIFTACAASGGGSENRTPKVGNVQSNPKGLPESAQCNSVQCNSNQTHTAVDSGDPSSRSQDNPPVTAAGSDDCVFTMDACLNSGHPIKVEWDGSERDFIDGFGLCSPTRWPPVSRGVRRTSEMKGLAAATFELLSNVVHECIPDLRLAAFELVTGKFQGSPFSDDVLKELRQRWANLLRDPVDALVIDDGQPFLLRGLAQWLSVFEDPDGWWLVDAEDSFASGVPLGVDAPLPRSPQVYPEKDRHRKLDESDFNPIAFNYLSAQVSAAELEAKFREEEQLGRMFSHEALCFERAVWRRSHSNRIDGSDFKTRRFGQTSPRRDSLG